MQWLDISQEHCLTSQYPDYMYENLNQTQQEKPSVHRVDLAMVRSCLDLKVLVLPRELFSLHLWLDPLCRLDASSIKSASDSHYEMIKREKQVNG